MASPSEKENPERRLDIRHYFLSPYTWGLVAAIALIIYFFARPPIQDEWSSWSPGTLHRSHAALNRDCATCHSEPFKPIEDKACVSCHTMSEHAVFAHQSTERTCVSCHVEHHGEEALIPKQSNLCVDCHANISAHSDKPQVENVPGFEQHPQFALGKAHERIRLDSKPGPLDRDSLKLNHALHLKKDLQGPDGRVTLTCESCHQLSKDLTQIIPVSFDKDCRSCHSLGFDDRSDAGKVPHGDPQRVFDFLLAEYAKFHGLDPQQAKRDAVRQIPGKPGESAGSRDLQQVLSEARKAEQLLFTKTACQTCHVVSDNKDAAPSANHFTVESPKIPTQWFVAARFSHAAHQTQTCISCHGAATNSKETSDVLLPRIQECKDCHVQAGHSGPVPSDCSMCHAYHKSERFSPAP